MAGERWPGEGCLCNKRIRDPGSPAVGDSDLYAAVEEVEQQTVVQRRPVLQMAGERTVRGMPAGKGPSSEVVEEQGWAHQSLAVSGETKS